MDFVPSERAVLRQVRDLFAESSVRTYRLTVLTSRWPAAHYEAYRGGYNGLLRRGLLVQSSGRDLFGITTAGLKAMA